MSFTFTAATLTTRDDRRRRPALNLGQIARTVLLLLACAAALGLMTRHGEAAQPRAIEGFGMSKDGMWAVARHRSVARDTFERAFAGLLPDLAVLARARV